MRTRAALLSAAWLAAAVSTAAAQAATPPECITLEDFARAKVGEFPADWKPRKDAGRDAYHVLEEQGIRFLHAASKRLGIQAAKQVEWDLDAYPVLAWSWRPREFPRGADERDSGTNDSALAVYLLVPYSRITGPKAVKYIWSEKVAVGTHLASNHGLTQVRVLRSGSDGRGEWRHEKVNVLEDYRTFFDAKESPKPIGIAVLTDADETKSSAAGDYAEFKICRK